MAAKKGMSIREGQEHFRRNVNAGQIRSRLQKHIDGEIELSSTQLRAAEILLKKVQPDLSATDFTSEGERITFSFGITPPKGVKK